MCQPDPVHGWAIVALGIVVTLLGIGGLASVHTSVQLRQRIEHLESIIKEKPNAKTE